ncbi:hypothetical protein M3231_15255 [Neobacillus mesonae]|nr:hypothetical protein [Neobacillus mesonae]
MNNVNVTVLKDEALGGVEREYNEVKRNASVGEKAKVIGGLCHSFRKGDVVTAIDEKTYVTDGVRFEREDGEVQTLVSWHGDYVVLEPSDIVRINSERFRMVDRKATVGDRVIITNAEFPSNYDVGETFIVERSEKETRELLAGIYVEALRNRRGQNVPGFVKDGKYRVLEPLTTPLSSRPVAEQSAEIIATLTAEVESLKKRVTALERADSPTVIQTEPALVAAVKSPQQIRDEIVERAKADVEGVKTPWNINANPQPLVYTYKMYVVDVEFVVNRNKRTVVAIARWRKNGEIISRGVAKCSPNDVFNAHIGKAIALRRALGLEVPAEYLSVPGPTEVRVGDVVEWGCTGSKYRVEKISGNFYNFYSYRLREVIDAIEYDDVLKYCKIIDDSLITVGEEVAA